MQFDSYQTLTGLTAIYPKEMALEYLTIGLGGEVGELLNIVKKSIRDDGGEITQGSKHRILDELGDVLWYASELCSLLDANFSEVAEGNINKLQSRKERGVLKGSGDKR